MKIVALCLVLAVVAVSAVPVPYTNCGKKGDILTIKSVDASVWPPVLGKNITVAASASVASTITGGNYKAAVFFDGIQIITKAGTLASLKIPLPINAGPYSINKTILVPTIPISGDIGVQVSATNSAGAEIACIKLTANIGAEHNRNVFARPDETNPYYCEMEGAAAFCCTSCGHLCCNHRECSHVGDSGASRRLQRTEEWDAQTSRDVCLAFSCADFPSKSVVNDWVCDKVSASC